MKTALFFKVLKINSNFEVFGDFMKSGFKKSFITGSILSALSMPVFAQHFSSMTVFGDSLSDSGNVGRFTVDGDKNALYDDHLASHYGLTLKPSSQGGNNFAQANADALPGLNPENVNTQDQVANYLASTGGKADPHGVYIHWIGSNDVANAPENPATATQTITNSANAAVSQVKELLDAGAGTVIVPNVPHLGNTPFVAETVASSLGPQAVAAVYQALNSVKTPDLASREAAVHAAFVKLASASSSDPTQQQTIADKLFSSWKALDGEVNQLADSYNQQEDAGLSQLHGNIVRADMAGLFDDIIADPAKFGLTNTVGTACPTGTAANECHSDQPGFNKDENYLFADRFHPTPAVHAIIADYIQSILNAPQQVGALSVAPQALIGDTQSSLDGNLQQLRENGPKGDFTSFFGYAGQHINDTDDNSSNGNANTSNFTFGFGYNVLPNWQVGLLYATSDNREHPTGDFNYKLRGNMFGVYSQLRLFNRGWISGDLHYADLDFDSIHRSFNLGSYRKTEDGSASGKDLGFRVLTGWDFPITDTVSTSPVLGYSLDYVHVGGYSEEGNSESAMRFGAQDAHTQTGSIGWRIDTKNLPVNPFAQVKYNHAWGDTNSDVRAGIKSTQTAFETSVSERDKNWVDFTVGANMPLGQVINAYAAVSTTASNSKADNIGWNVGLSATF
ncbi:autotransporter outer membrane beta-barrel domain-containing protein [Pantoea sp. ICBG 1758]|uniref:autotransporter outer membrane beta-barrel domain-containing protein n=1 Tax=Pantoea sp. ICBG 1758 TaxID=2071682 RepID=UPI0035110154